MKALDEYFPCFLFVCLFVLFVFSIFMFNLDRETSAVKGLKIIYCIKLDLPGYKLSRNCMMDSISPPPIPIVKPANGL